MEYGTGTLDDNTNPTSRPPEPSALAVQAFAYPMTQQDIRTITIDGAAWIHHADVCVALEHTNPSMAIRLVEDDDKHKFDMRSISAGGNALSFAEGVNTEAWFITEPGFYDLVIASKASGARAFKRWVTHEVLPAIRATGKYEVAEHRLPSSYAEALRELAAIVEECEAVKIALATAEPKADAWDVLASATGDYAVADAAKILSRDPVIKLGRNRLFTVLGELGWTYRQRCDNHWRVYQTAVDNGRMSEIPQSHYHPRTGELQLDPPQTRITTKGIADLRRILGGTEPLSIDR